MKRFLGFGLTMTCALSMFLGSLGANQNDVFAAPSSACPSFCQGWEFDLLFRALALQPTTSRLDYAVEVDTTSSTPGWKVHNVNPNYDFGFDLGLEAFSRESYSNVVLEWSHFYTKNSRSVSLADGEVVGPFFELALADSPYNNAFGKATFNFDSINLDYGVFVDLGSYLRANFFAGVNGAYIKETLYSEFSNTDDSSFRSIHAPSKFTGAGPQLGFDFAYRFCDGFHLTGEAATSLLVGTASNHTTFESTSPLLTVTNVQHTSVRNTTQVVPALEGRLGLAYSYSFCSDYTFRLEAGYEAKVFFNAIQSVDVSSQDDLASLTGSPSADTGVYPRTFQRTVSNFALAGPYLTVDFMF